MRAASGKSVVAAAAVGNALEWFDFTVYSLFSPMIGKAFFPTGSELASLLLALATFGVGFVLRPVGAIVIGHYADRSGRRAALSLVIILMSIGTAIVAFTPGYGAIGVAAPILIVLARLIQGFSVGGEFGGVTAFLIESAPPERRGLYASWQFAGQALAAVAGSLFGVAMTSLMPQAEIESWGWRLPFFFGLMIAPVGLYLRAGMEEGEAFLRAVKSARSPLMEVWHGYRGSVAISFGITILGTAVVYLVVFYMPTYATKLLGIPARAAFLSATVSSLLYSLINPLAGRLSDKIGRTKLVLAAALALTLFAVPLYRLLTFHPDGETLFAVQGLLASLLALFAGPSAALIGELFPPEVRSTGISIGYNIAVPIFGGFAPYFVTRLDTGDHLAPAWYMIACALPTLAALAALLRQHSRHSATMRSDSMGAVSRTTVK
ncbi:MAG TPA: MFS transporter [Alphaproteobacteria bacterium]|nr:MFS transporter [Alphaproteobacteria bacterium]